MTKKKGHNIKTIPTNDGKAHVMTDGWVNTLTGIGVKGKDKSVSATIGHSILDQQTAETLYAGDDIAHKIVERLPKDGVREWIEFQNLPTEVEAKLNDVIKKLDLKSKVEKAWVYARLYGGSGLFINFGEQINGDQKDKLAEPINGQSIREVMSLTLLNSHELQGVSKLTNDLGSKNFGLPDLYNVTPQESVASALVVHHSRIVRFEGSTLPTQMFVTNGYWNDSVLSKIFQIISKYNQAHQASSDMLLDFRVAIIKLKNLFQMVAQGDDAKVKQRMELIKMQKSVINMVLLNEGEEFEHNTHSLAGVNDILNQVNNRMVTASGYPHTVLLGDSPSGLGATGDSELRDYYDMVAQEQEAKLRKPLEEIFNYIFLSKSGPTGGKIPENFDFKFVPLWQISDIERAKMELDVANKDAIYIANGVLDEQEVAISRYGGKEFSQDTKLSDDRQAEISKEKVAQTVEREELSEIGLEDSVSPKNKMIWDSIKAIFRNGSAT